MNVYIFKWLTYGPQFLVYLHKLSSFYSYANGEYAGRPLSSGRQKIAIRQHILLSLCCRPGREEASVKCDINVIVEVSLLLA